MENETGEGVITRYPVFPGIELLYDDIHMSCGVAHREDPRADLLEINHCRLGRFECEFSDGSAVYLGEGDLAVNVMTNRTRETWFPLSHYHGITIAVDIPVADRVLRQTSEALGEGLYCDLFAMRDRLCARNSCFIMRATESIQHIFSELYHAPENLRAGYFKLKVMELFLFLGSPEITARGEERPYVDRTQVEQIKSVRQYLVEHLDRRITFPPRIAEAFLTADGCSARIAQGTADPNRSYNIGKTALGRSSVCIVPERSSASAYRFP